MDGTGLLAVLLLVLMARRPSFDKTCRNLGRTSRAPLPPVGCLRTGPSPLALFGADLTVS